MLLHSVLSFLLGKPPLMSSGNRPDAVSVSQHQTKTDICMTLAHLFPLLLPEFTALFSSCFFLKYFFFPPSLFIFSVIPKAVIFLVVIGIVGCGFADSVEALKKWLFPYYNFPRTRVSLQLYLTPWFSWEMPEHGPSFCMHRNSSPPARAPKKRTWVTPQAVAQGTVRDRAFPDDSHKDF